MHKVYENDDMLMYFKKRHCCCCGNTLTAKKVKRIVGKSDPSHSDYCNIGTHYHLYEDILVIGREYYCPACNKSFSCDKQKAIIKAQKHFKRYIVSEDEIVFVEKYNTSTSISNIKKMKWFLLIPVIGWFICLFYISNGILNKKMYKYDGYILIGVPFAIIIIVALIMKLIFLLVGTNSIFYYTYYVFIIV